VSGPPPGLQSIDVQEADARRSSDASGRAPLLLDVRERDEFEEVRVPGAALLPMSEFASRFGELPRDRPLLVMCAAGSRSLAAAGLLIRNGYDAVNVTGGIIAWQKAGLPVRRGRPDPDEGALPNS
jgi:rhodanese-related sulfurtransferase